MSLAHLFMAPLVAEVDNQVAMFTLCFDYVLIFYAWTSLQFNYGPKNLYDCPAEPCIPIFLCTAAFTQIFIIICIIVPCWCSDWSMEGMRKKAFIGLHSVLGFALFIIYVLGAVWTFNIYSLVTYDNQRASDYCDPGTFRFSMWSLIITFAALWITIIVFFITTWWPKISRRSEYSDLAANV